MTGQSPISTTPAFPILTAAQTNKLTASLSRPATTAQGPATVSLQVGAVPYNTPILKFDASAGLQILINRNPSTGATISQIPTAAAILRYQQTLDQTPGRQIAKATNTRGQQPANTNAGAVAITQVSHTYAPSSSIRSTPIVNTAKEL